MHEGQVEPAAELLAHLRHLPADLEAEAPVQADRGGIAAFDGGHHDVQALGPRTFDQRLQQLHAEAFAALVVAHVDGVLDGAAEALEGSPVAVGGVAEHFAGGVACHQDRVALAGAGVEPGLAVGQVHRGFVPDRRGIAHGVVVDGEDAGQVGDAGVADRSAHGRPQAMGWWTVTSLVPSGKVASTWMSGIISGTPSITCSRLSRVVP